MYGTGKKHTELLDIFLVLMSQFDNYKGRILIKSYPYVNQNLKLVFEFSNVTYPQKIHFNALGRGISF